MKLMAVMKKNSLLREVALKQNRFQAENQSRFRNFSMKPPLEPALQPSVYVSEVFRIRSLLGFAT